MNERGRGRVRERGWGEREGGRDKVKGGEREKWKKIAS